MFNLSEPKLTCSRMFPSTKQISKKYVLVIVYFILHYWSSSPQLFSKGADLQGKQPVKAISNSQQDNKPMLMAPSTSKPRRRAPIKTTSLK